MEKKQSSVVEQFIDLVVGAVDYSADQLAKAFDALVERGKLSSEDASKVIKEMTERGRQDRDKIRDKMKTAFDKMRYVSRQEFEDLKARVKALEK